MSAKDDRPLRPPGPTRSESAVVAVMLTAIVLPSAFQAIVFRRAPNPPAIERSEERRYDLKIDVNLCNRFELEHLPGIGPKLAERIIASRAEDGPFATARDLMRVKGIGPKLLAKMEPYLAFPPEGKSETSATTPKP
jgi:competence ComEA-like helix-hairpin-helix protein